jgi:hypothetical protein
MADLNLISLLVMVGALMAAVMYGKLSRRKSRFDIAQMQFFEMTLHSENSKFSFNPKTATIVRQDIDQTNGESTTYAITIYARNESGEYFVYRSDGVAPSIKHLEHGIAKIVLKNEYISPQEAG